jgi:hypothetical protein
MMPSGASQALEEITKASANEISQVIHGTPGQIIGQNRRTTKHSGSPDRHLGLRLVVPASRGPYNVCARSDQTVPGNKWPISFQSHRF